MRRQAIIYAFLYFKYIFLIQKNREWDRNRSFVRIRFRRPTSAQLSRAVKADEISVVEPTQPLRLVRQSKNNLEARTFVPASWFFAYKGTPKTSRDLSSEGWSLRHAPN